MARKPFVLWVVNGEEYKLRLTTRQVCDVEEKLGVNLLKIFMPSAGEEFNLPPLKVMLVIIQGALQKFHHGITLSDVFDLFDGYVDEGKSQAELMSDVILPLFQASGFIPQSEEDNPTLTAVK